MTLTITEVVVTLGIHAVALCGLWLRLRWRVEQQRGHHRYMVTLARFLPADSRVDDIHGDGQRTQLTIGKDRDIPS